MALEHSNFSMGFRFGREASAGGAGNYANRTAELLNVEVSPTWDTNVYRGKGRRYAGGRVIGNERATGSGGGPLGFADILVPLLSKVKNVTPVAGANGSQVWTFIPNPRGGDPIQTWYGQTTDEDLNIHNRHLMWTSWGFEAGRGEATHSGDVLAQETDVIPAPSGLAGPLAPQWSAATQFNLGAVVRRLTGAGTYQFRATAIAGTGTSAAVTEPTWPASLGLTVIDNPGANQITWTAIEDVSEMENVLVVPEDCDIFYNMVGMNELESSPTQLMRSFRYGFNLGGGHMEFSDINSARASFTGVTENEVDATVTIDLGLTNNAGKTDFLDPFTLARARQAGKVWVRWQALGPLIGGSTYYLLQFDACCQIADPYGFSDMQGLFGSGIPLGIVNDPVVGYPWKAKIVNKTKSNLLTGTWA